MSGADMNRESYGQTVALTTSATGTPLKNFGNKICGEIYIPSGSSITTLTYYAVRPNSDGTNTCIPAYDALGLPVTQTVVANGAYPLPDAVAGCNAIYIQANAAGSVYIDFKA